MLNRRSFGLGFSGLVISRRAGAATVASDDIVIGLVTAKTNPDVAAANAVPRAVQVRSGQSDIGGSLRAGVELAVAEINEAGGVLGRKIRVEAEELTPGGSGVRGRAIDIARRLVGRPGLIAVIGHVGAEDALPASITYSEHGVLFIAPTITLCDLNGHGLTNVFASIPDNREIGKQTATFCFGQGLRSAAVLRSRTDEAEEQSLAFLDQIAAFGMPDIAQVSYMPGRKDFREILADLRPKSFDAFFIAAPAAEAALIIRQSYELQIPATFVLGGLCDLEVLIAGVRDVPSKIIVPVLEDASIDAPPLRAFFRNFRRRYGRDGDDWSLQGYDTVCLLAATIVQTQSLDPQALISTLRYAISWTGLLGRYSFERNGRVYTRSLSFAQLSDGALSYFSLSS
jgi:branched-chain amino acid transport system substrate-binding protein